MIPGMANNPALKNVQVDPRDIERTKAIVYSMTSEERENPDILNSSRRRRISAGCGVKIQDVNRMIKQFKQMRDMMGKVSNGDFSGMEGLFGNGMGGKLAKMSMSKMVRKNKKKKLRKLQKARRRRKR